jgi:hypothetical protein
MKEKDILFGDVIRSSTMWRGESGMAYNSFYMLSLGYGTPATTSTKKDCEEIWALLAQLREPCVFVSHPSESSCRSLTISLKGSLYDGREKG